MIVAHALTESTVDDATVGMDLIGASAGDVASVTADAAYDTVAFYEAARARHAQGVVPPTRTARVEAHRLSRRPHFLGGWGQWDVQVGFRRRCVSAPSGW
jgi:hypothetical protein